MASRPLHVAVLLFVFLNEVSFLKLMAKDHDHVVFVNGGGSDSPAPLLDCAGLCGVRCSRHSRPNVCQRACGTCCERCGCVPPGTFGNRDLCGPCYANMTTHANRTKCP
ncbi:hypothetical protein KFK09_013036 [Dendrobium nobile]|uniref:Uncharacterized protein n=1 Tax=Dendrobium nobile TaxID=94219 RepID=A0A8T3BJG6_DENNO|nr:hypothetical protein KFK09_013036 [Dendrobium nobile]